MDAALPLGERQDVFQGSRNFRKGAGGAVAPPAFFMRTGFADGGRRFQGKARTADKSMVVPNKYLVSQPAGDSTRMGAEKVQGKRRAQPPFSIETGGGKPRRLGARNDSESPLVAPRHLRQSIRTQSIRRFAACLFGKGATLQARNPLRLRERKE